MISEKKNRNHVYIQRSCNNCNKLSDCLQRFQRDESQTWCDYGKYGCFYYDGEFNLEERKDLYNKFDSYDIEVPYT